MDSRDRCVRCTLELFATRRPWRYSTIAHDFTTKGAERSRPRHCKPKTCSSADARLHAALSAACSCGATLHIGQRGQAERRRSTFAPKQSSRESKVWRGTFTTVAAAVSPLAIGYYPRTRWRNCRQSHAPERFSAACVKPLARIRNARRCRRHHRYSSTISGEIANLQVRTPTMASAISRPDPISRRSSPNC